MSETNYNGETIDGLTIKLATVNLLVYLIFSFYIGGVLVSVLSSSVVDHGFEPGSSKIKYF